MSKQNAKRNPALSGKKKFKLTPNLIAMAAGLIIANYVALHLGHALSLFHIFDEVGIGMTADIFGHNLTAAPFIFFQTLFSGAFTFLTAAMANIIIYLAYITSKEKRKSFRAKKEYGSAALAKPIDFAHLRHPYKSHNIILSKYISLSIDHHATGININIFIIGGPGSGKTRGFMKPNILNLAHKEVGKGANMVITDPKGNLLKSVGKFLKKQGYVIKVLNLSNIAKSDYYNPLLCY